MNKKYIKKRKGYIFVEAAISICISLCVMLSVASAMENSTKIIEKNDCYVELYEQANEIERFIKREIRNSESIKFYKGNKIIAADEEFRNIDRIELSQYLKNESGTIYNERLSIRISSSNNKISVYKGGSVYEIGTYIDTLQVRQYKVGKTVELKLVMKLDDSLYEKFISIRMRNVRN